MPAENIQTLHSHSLNSDGQLSYLKTLEVCEQNNISVVAFTDHDALINKNGLKDLRNYKGKVKWISGIEVSSALPKELGGGIIADFHIVGLFVDPTNKKLLDHCALASKARITRMQKMVTNLQSLGFDITEDDCLKASSGESVGRPHVVTALLSKQKNKDVLMKLKEKMEDEAKDNTEVRKKYDAMIERGEGQYPYIIFLSDDAYIPNIYVHHQYFVDMDAAVKLIRNAGGLAILAHYYSCVGKINEELLDKILRDNRLDGAEVVYGLFCLNTGTEIEKTVIKSSEIINRLVKKHSKLQSGGADAHKLKDFVDFANSGEYAEKTEGMAEEIIKQSNTDTTWSNF